MRSRASTTEQTRSSSTWGERRSEPRAERATIGRYLLIETAGQGGMGVVLRAYDPKLQREVALKVLRGGAMGVEAQARMVREARAMAQLSHPNVVSVYDVELENEEGVVVAMELVRGETLRQWLEASHPWREVVDRFAAAGRGLAAAHDAGLLHRDFKPSNVLVGSDGRVRVTDFGLARAQSSGPGTEDGDALSVPDGLSVDTTQGGVVLGTPAYMAPEQHQGAELTPAADQYAFCVSLWQGLTGKLPFVAEADALFRIKIERRPDWPAHVSVPKAIVDALTRGLLPRPSERWPSIHALLELLAIDPSARRRRWFAVAAGVSVLGLAGLGAADWHGRRAQRCTGAEAELANAWSSERRQSIESALLATNVSYAPRVWERIGSQLDLYGQNWTEMHTATCEATTIRGEQSTEVMDLRMGCLSDAKLELRAATDLLANADAQVVKKAHEVVDELPRLARCADVAALRAEVPPPPEAEAAAVAAVREGLAIAKTLQKAGKFEEALAVAAEARAAAESVAFEPLQTELALRVASVHGKLGHYSEAEAEYERALQSAVEWGQWSAVSEAARNLMYVVGSRQRRHAEAMAYLGLVRGLAERSADPLEEAAFRDSFATVLLAQGEYQRAEGEFRIALELREQGLGPDHLEVAGERNNLAGALYNQGRYAEAEAEYRAALAVRERAFGSDHPGVLTARENLAAMLDAQGNHAEAERELRSVLSTRTKVLGPDHPDLAGSHNNLAVVLYLQGRQKEAVAEYRAALAIHEKVFGPDHPNVARARSNLGVTLQSLGHYAKAEAEHRAALAISEKALGPLHPSVGTARNNLGLVLAARKKYAEAEAEHRAALAIRRQTLDDDHPQIATSETNIAKVLLELERWDEALALIEHAWDVRQADAVASTDRADTAFAFARVLWALKRERSRARELAERARRDWAAIGQSGLAKDVAAWLAQRR